MARNIQTVVDTLMLRVRQEGGIALDSDVATEVYSRCEQVTNAALKRVLASGSFTVLAATLLYSYRTQLTKAIEIVDVETSTREIPESQRFADFSAYELAWYGNVTGTRTESWAQRGRDILVLYPGLASGTTVTVKYVKLIDLYTTYASVAAVNSELPDEDVDIALALAELTFLLRFRLLDKIPQRFESIIKLLQHRGFEL